MNRSLTFGRGPGADVTVDDEYATAVHCRVTESGGVYFVEDCGSTNGTFIRRKNGDEEIRVQGPTRLRRGDKVRIGRTNLPWEGR